MSQLIEDEEAIKHESFIRQFTGNTKVILIELHARGLSNVYTFITHHLTNCRRRAMSVLF